jgi:hypothetical protein
MATSILQLLMQDMFRCGTTEQVFREEEEEELPTMGSASTTTTTRTPTSMSRGSDVVDKKRKRRRQRGGIVQRVPSLCGGGGCGSDEVVADDNDSDAYRYVIRMSPEKKHFKRGDYPELSMRRTQSESLSQLPLVVSVTNRK